MTQSATIGASYCTKTHLLKSPKSPECTAECVKYQIWDTSGDSRFTNMAPLYLAKADVVMLVYSITSRETFERVGRWVRILEAQTQGESGCRIVVVGTKSDLSVHREVTLLESENYAESINASHFDTSSLTNSNVHEMFEEIARQELNWRAKKHVYGERNWSKGGESQVRLGQEGSDDLVLHS